MKKRMYIVLGLICVIFITLIVFYKMLVVSPNNYREKQGDYFSKTQIVLMVMYMTLNI